MDCGRGLPGGSMQFFRSISQSKVRGGPRGHPTMTEGRGSLRVEDEEVCNVKMSVVKPCCQSFPISLTLSLF